VSWFSLVIGQNAIRQLATSSENLVASAQFLVALATSESQFRALVHHVRNFSNSWFSHDVTKIRTGLGRGMLGG